MMVLLFLLLVVLVFISVGLIIWQQDRYALLRIDSLEFHPQSITEISDAKEHLNKLQSWADKAANKQGEIFLDKRKIMGSNPLAILALIKQHISLLLKRQSPRKKENYDLVANRALAHIDSLSQLLTPNVLGKTVSFTEVIRKIRGLSIDLAQWRRLHEIDYVKDEIIFSEFKNKTNQFFYIILVILFLITTPLAILFVRRINLALHHIEDTQEQLSELNQTLEMRVEQRTHEIEKMQDSLVRNERLAALGKLTGTVSHELRNPLGTITTSLFTLRNKLQGQAIDVNKVIDRIERNIKRCDDIVEDLLQYSRIQELHLESLAFEPWFEEIVNEYKQREGLRIYLEMENIGDVKFDPHRLRRVFINLFDNAIRVMSINNKISPGSVIWIKVFAENSGVLISITDTGSGVAVDIRDHIFEPLFSTHAFGVGLGLSIVRQIIEQHGGTIELDSSVSEGACFRCWLPKIAVKRDEL